MIIEKAISYIISIILVIFSPFMIVFNIVHFRSKWKCREKHYDRFINRCHEENCKWAQCCENYQHIYTDEEIKELYRLLEKYQKNL